jgi:uncharacterized protein YkwD
MQQHGHPPVLQVLLHLRGPTTSRGSKQGAALAAALLACVGALIADTATAATTPPPCPGASLHPSPVNIRAVDAATLCVVNQVRGARGLRPLRANRALGHVAAGQVTSMVRGDYFADVRPSGQTPLSLVAVTRYPAHAVQFAVGQNIAWGTDSFTTPTHIVAEWMASPPHREIMLSGEYRDAGVAVLPAVPAVLHPNGPGATYVIEFGARF